MKNEKRDKELHLLVDAGTANVVRGAAARLGYTTTSGRMAGQGNLSGLLRGLATGRVDASEFERALEQEREGKLVSLEGENDG